MELFNACNRISRFIPRAIGNSLAAIEAQLAAERHQLPLWLPVFMGIGIIGWFILPHRTDWYALLCLFAAMCGLGITIGHSRLLGRALIISGVAASLGLALIWFRAEHVAARVLARPVVTRFDARVIAVEYRAANEKWRYLLAPLHRPDLPEKLRLNHSLAPPPDIIGGVLQVRARLVPPAPASLPGGYDFQQVAWFQGLGATGTMLDPPRLIQPPGRRTLHHILNPLRASIADHITHKLSPAAGGVAISLATGNAGQMPAGDADAMRQSGLAHLLSVSGLHISAVVGATVLLTTSLLALSQRIALRLPIPIIGAGIAALTAIGYTLLTGAEVPAVRACIAALLILIGMALGRRALSMRLVATGVLLVLPLWPESVIGPSFQMSFAAIIAIVALHEHPKVKALLARREEPFIAKMARIILGLILTGLAVEIMLMPIVLYHFHRTGLYGALANIVAIPLTTFIVMPLEAAALLLDLFGLGAPLWWAVEQSISLLLALAHKVASLPGATLMLPSMGRPAFALMIGGGLWLLLWQTRWRWAGLLPVAAGAVLTALAPAPDLLVTRDGRHVLLRLDDNAVALLRGRAGDYMRTTLAEGAGMPTDSLTQGLADLQDRHDVHCSRDACTTRLHRDGRTWTIGFIRSDILLPWDEMRRYCRQLDIVIAPRRLPAACAPRWLRWDRPALETLGGAALSLSPPSIRQGESREGDHPWQRAAEKTSPSGLTVSRHSWFVTYQ